MAPLQLAMQSNQRHTATLDEAELNKWIARISQNGDQFQLPGEVESIRIEQQPRDPHPLAQPRHPLLAISLLEDPL